MDLEKILDLISLVSVICSEGYNKLEKGSPMSNHLRSVGLARSAHPNSENLVLTEKGRRVFDNVDLIKYELYMANRLIVGDINGENYRYGELRKALGTYFKTSIETNFIRLLESLRNKIPKDCVVLDAGGGSGEYSRTFQRLYPKGIFHLLDNGDVTGVDANIISKKGNILEISDYPLNKFNVIMANEVIHCLSEDKVNTFLDVVYDKLIDNGILIITEQQCTDRVRLRLDTFSDGRMYTWSEIYNMATSHGFKKLMREHVTFANHYFMVYQK